VCEIEYYLTIKKSEIMSFARQWMELGIIMLSEVSQLQNAKCHMFSFVDPKPKMMVVVVMMAIGHERERGWSGCGQWKGDGKGMVWVWSMEGDGEREGC
jgi:hypothetical protein